MMNSQSFLIRLLGLILVVSIIVPSIADDAVPVLLWGGTTVGESDSNPFKKTSQAYLEDIVSKKLGESQPPVLVFVKNNLCTEDITQHSKGLAPLKNSKSFQYFFAVDSPLAIFKKLSSYNQSMEVELESVSEGQLFITEVTDLDSVPEIFYLIEQSNPHLVAALTGNYCSYRSERGKRATEMKVDNGTESFLITSARLLLYADHSPVLTVNGSDPIDLGDVSSKVKEKGDGTAQSPLIITMEFTAKDESTSFTAIFDLEITVENSGYYTLKQINMSRDNKYETTLEIRPAIYWAYNSSYHCSPNTTFSDKNGTSLSFENLQVQIDAKKFGETYDCVGFTSVPIWSAMFITTVVSIITLWGILMIMDIRTMDRFDDPKGKTISISVTE